MNKVIGGEILRKYYKIKHQFLRKKRATDYYVQRCFSNSIDNEENTSLFTDLTRKEKYVNLNSSLTTKWYKKWKRSDAHAKFAIRTELKTKHSYFV